MAGAKRPLNSLPRWRLDFSAALPYAREATAAFREMGMLPDQWRMQRLLRNTLEHLGDSPAENERLAGENQSLLTQMAGFLPLEDQITYLLNKPTEHEEFLSRKIRIMQQSEKGRKNWWRRSRAIVDTQKTLNSLLDDVYWERESSALLPLRGEGGTKVTRPSTPLWKRVLMCRRDQAQIAFVGIHSGKAILSRAHAG
jgi:hypothetical protein